MENTNNTNHPADNGPRPAVSTTVNFIPFEPRKWKVANDGKVSHLAERTMVTDMAGGMTEVLTAGSWDHWNQWSFTTSPHFSLKKHTDYVFTFWLNGGENELGSEVCQLRIHHNSVWDDKNPYVFKLNRNYIKESKHVAGWYRFDIPFNSGEYDTDDPFEENTVMQLQFCAQNAYAAFMPHKPEFDDLNDEPLPDPRIPQRHNIKFAGGYPRDSSWSYLVYGESATRGDTRSDSHGKQAQVAGNKMENNTNNSGNRSSLIDLASAGVDIESFFDDMESGDIMELLRNTDLNALASCGINVNSLLDNLESWDKKELLLGMLGN